MIILGEDEIFIPDIQYVVFRECHADWRLNPHPVANYDITYIIKGRARYTIDRCPYELSSGALLCLSDRLDKAALTYPDQLMHCFSVNFMLKNSLGQQVALPLPLISTIGLKDDLIRLFNELVSANRERHPGYGIKCRGILLLILHRLLELTVYSSTRACEDYRVQKTMRYIGLHYAEQLQVKKLALITGLNPSYFGFLFKRVTGLTVKRYIARTRVQNAKDLLQSGSLKVQDVADACGYCDVFHFYKQFKTIMGIPPSHCIPKKGADT
ncbi:MAG: AraC family transcriptional regulator [Spirochaetaceae bacterium]|nr:AraC family transcriptional regulator [Spirochaetaceae bacterium]